MVEFQTFRKLLLAFSTISEELQMQVLIRMDSPPQLGSKNFTHI